MNDHTIAAGEYFRMPNEWLFIEASPGAKVLLSYFCSLARDRGTVFPSYRKCTEVVCRSRASVCAYVKELVELGMITTQKQVNKYGANKHLEISIVGWKDIVARFSRRKPTADETASPKKSATRHSQPAQKAERAVQPAECNNPSGYESTKTKTNTPRSPFVEKAATAIVAKAPESVWSKKDDAEWARFRPCRKQPTGQHGPLPRAEIVERLRAHVAFLETETGLLNLEALTAYIAARARRFVVAHRLEANDEALTDFESTLRSLCISKAEVDGFFAALNKQWSPGWRKLSTAAQVKAAYAEADIRSLRPRGRAAMDLFEYRGHLNDYELIARRHRSALGQAERAVAA